MEQSDPLVFRLWSLGFRALALGLLVLGTLVAVVGALVFAVALIRGLPSSSHMSIGEGAIMLIGGMLFAEIGRRGLKIRSRKDLDADIEQTAKDRDRLEQWINH